LEFKQLPSICCNFLLFLIKLVGDEGWRTPPLGMDADASVPLSNPSWLLVMEDNMSGNDNVDAAVVAEACLDK